MSWRWPGAAPQRRRRSRTPLRAQWVHRADAAVAEAVAARPEIARDARVLQAWCAAFFEAAGEAERERLWAHAVRDKAFAPYGDERVDALLRWWTKRERARRQGELGFAAEDRVVAPAFAPRERRRAQRKAADQTTIAEWRPRGPVLPLADAERVLDDALAAFDVEVERIMGRRFR